MPPAECIDLTADSPCVPPMEDEQETDPGSAMTHAEPPPNPQPTTAQDAPRAASSDGSLPTPTQPGPSASGASGIPPPIISQINAPNGEQHQSPIVASRTSGPLTSPASAASTAPNVLALAAQIRSQQQQLQQHPRSSVNQPAQPAIARPQQQQSISQTQVNQAISLLLSQRPVQPIPPQQVGPSQTNPYPSVQPHHGSAPQLSHHAHYQHVRSLAPPSQQQHQQPLPPPPPPSLSASVQRQQPQQQQHLPPPPPMQQQQHQQTVSAPHIPFRHAFQHQQPPPSSQHPNISLPPQQPQLQNVRTSLPSQSPAEQQSASLTPIAINENDTTTFTFDPLMRPIVEAIRICNADLSKQIITYQQQIAVQQQQLGDIVQFSRKLHDENAAFKHQSQSFTRQGSELKAKLEQATEEAQNYMHRYDEERAEKENLLRTQALREDHFRDAVAQTLEATTANKVLVTQLAEVEAKYNLDTSNLKDELEQAKNEALDMKTLQERAAAQVKQLKEKNQRDGQEKAEQIADLKDGIKLLMNNVIESRRAKEVLEGKVEQLQKELHRSTAEMEVQTEELHRSTAEMEVQTEESPLTALPDSISSRTHSEQPPSQSPTPQPQQAANHKPIGNWNALLQLRNRQNKALQAKVNELKDVNLRHENEIAALKHENDGLKKNRQEDISRIRKEVEEEIDSDMNASFRSMIDAPPSTPGNSQDIEASTWPSTRVSIHSAPSPAPSESRIQPSNDQALAEQRDIWTKEKQILLDAHSQTLVSEKTKTDSQLAEKEQTILSLIQERDEARASLLASESSLASVRAEKEQNATSSEAELIRLSDSLEQTRTNMKQLDEEKREVITLQRRQSDQLETSLKEVKVLKDQYTQIITKLKKAQDDALEDKLQIGLFETSIEQDRDNWEREKNNLGLKLAEMKEEKDAAQAECDATKERLRQAETQLRDTIATSTDERKLLEDKLSSAQEDAKATREQFTEMEAKHQDMQGKLVELTERLAKEQQDSEQDLLAVRTAIQDKANSKIKELEEALRSEKASKVVEERADELKQIPNGEPAITSEPVREPALTANNPDIQSSSSEEEELSDFLAYTSEDEEQDQSDEENTSLPPPISRRAASIAVDTPTPADSAFGDLFAEPDSRLDEDDDIEPSPRPNASAVLHQPSSPHQPPRPPPTVTPIPKGMFLTPKLNKTESAGSSSTIHHRKKASNSAIALLRRRTDPGTTLSSDISAIHCKSGQETRIHVVHRTSEIIDRGRDPTPVPNNTDATLASTSTAVADTVIHVRKKTIVPPAAPEPSSSQPSDGTKDFSSSANKGKGRQVTGWNANKNARKISGFGKGLHPPAPPSLSLSGIGKPSCFTSIQGRSSSGGLMAPPPSRSQNTNRAPQSDPGPSSSQASQNRGTSSTGLKRPHGQIRDGFCHPESSSAAKRQKTD